VAEAHLAAHLGLRLLLRPGVVAGGGRNTKKLMEHARELHLVDFNQYAITLCRFRFMDYTGPCKLHFHVNNGKSLP